MRWIQTLAITPLFALAAAPQSKSPAPAQGESIAAMAESVAGSGSDFDRTLRLVRWINDSFTWSATDYQRRTPAEIIAQRKGNCAELASALNLLLGELHIQTRWVHEINVQPAPTPGRQAGAEVKVEQAGNQMSVFGLQHNDHVWLEVRDESTHSWFPADPAYGVVGLKEWLPARLALDHRPRPRVEAVVPIAADMLVPFVVVAGSSRGGPYDVDRTSYYLIDQ